MSEQEIKKLQELAEKKLAKGMTREEAVRSLQNAGILDKKENFTPPYRTLGEIITASR